MCFLFAHGFVRSFVFWSSHIVCVRMRESECVWRCVCKITLVKHEHNPVAGIREEVVRLIVCICRFAPSRRRHRVPRFDSKQWFTCSLSVLMITDITIRNKFYTITSTSANNDNFGGRILPFTHSVGHSVLLFTYFWILYHLPSPTLRHIGRLTWRHLLDDDDRHGNRAGRKQENTTWKKKKAFEMAEKWKWNRRKWNDDDDRRRRRRERRPNKLSCSPGQRTRSVQFTRCVNYFLSPFTQFRTDHQRAAISGAKWKRKWKKVMNKITVKSSLYFVQ